MNAFDKILLYISHILIRLLILDKYDELNSKQMWQSFVLYKETGIDHYCW